MKRSWEIPSEMYLLKILKEWRNNHWMKMKRMIYLPRKSKLQFPGLWVLCQRNSKAMHFQNSRAISSFFPWFKSSLTIWKQTISRVLYTNFWTALLHKSSRSISRKPWQSRSTTKHRYFQIYKKWPKTHKRVKESLSSRSWLISMYSIRMA